ncbi:mtm1, partial [Symbiodinium microadriaticum]
AGGGGFEAYPNCRVIFGGIENIHAVRDAWRAMGAAVRNIVEGQVGSWFKDVANSGWYDYIGLILGSTLKVVEEILYNQANVVIHCSDGWDRTAQVSSLVMLCLDPYYRTQEGFLKLVQKEWCSFGHRFRTRLAIGEQPTAEYSPVFIQWLECVFQLQQQFPDTFEFAPPVLIRLADEVFSNRYGTFFCDNEQERRKVEKQTLSLWTTLLDER